MKFGFFDSGLGGLLMMQSCMRQYHHHDYIYVGDTKNLPYGPRDFKEIESFMSPYVLWMINERKCNYVFIACNTASVKALPLFYKKFPHYKKQVIGIVEPTLAYIQSLKDIDSLLILATQGTVNSNVYAHNLSLPTHQIAMPGLVELIEKNRTSEAEIMVKNALSYHPQNKNILLACTHYVSLVDFLEHEYSQNIISQDIILQDLIQKISGNYIAQEIGNREYYISGNHMMYQKNLDITFKKLSL